MVVSGYTWYRVALRRSHRRQALEKQERESTRGDEQQERKQSERSELAAVGRIGVHVWVSDYCIINVLVGISGCFCVINPRPTGWVHDENPSVSRTTLLTAFGELPVVVLHSLRVCSISHFGTMIPRVRRSAV